MNTRNRPDNCCIVPVLPAELTRPAQDRLVAVFRALGDSTRLEIFRLIAAQSAPICVCDITARFDVSQPTISHHLKVLRDAGLVTVSRQGVWAYYEPSGDGLEVLSDAVAAIAPAQVAVVR